jgi:hypothetical protein
MQGGCPRLEPWEGSDPTVILRAEKLYRGCKPEAEQAAIPGPLAPTAVSSRAIDLAAKALGLVVAGWSSALQSGPGILLTDNHGCRQSKRLSR